MNWKAILQDYTLEEVLERADIDVLELLMELEQMGYFEKLNMTVPTDGK